MSVFSENLVEDKSRGKLVRDTAMLESEWPAHTATGVGIANQSGVCTPPSGSASILLSLPSGRWYKLRTIIIDNQNVAQNHITLYEGGAGVSLASGYLFGTYVDPRSTLVIALDCITAGASIWANADLVGNTTIKIGGILVASMAEN